MFSEISYLETINKLTFLEFENINNTEILVT